MSRRSVLPLVLAGCIPCTAHAQNDTTARLVGNAWSAFNGEPLAGVMISVPAARRFAVTDSTGAFSLEGLPSGKQKIRISYEGRATEEYEFALHAGRAKRVAIVLDAAAVDLAPVVVEARYPDSWRDLAGFYERRRIYGGFARFYTREDIERNRPLTLATLLLRDGVTTRCLRTGCLPMLFSRGRECSMSVSVDGMPFWEQEYDRIAIDEVAAVEVYRGTIQPQVWSAAIGQNQCGSVQIWTR